MAFWVSYNDRLIFLFVQSDRLIPDNVIYQAYFTCPHYSQA
ncbi:hypothetical protein D1AOALGA4SA_1816 [Olavius algarvensis Delta 1 endosymbiont]|nr:hypothetical protein D1AOALGA4SA_1816 [Olavius algarvensis Delta 1 endosymbiont]